MVSDVGAVEALVRIGLTEYEARIYIILAKLGPRKASEISFLSKVPRQKTYGAMKGLEAKGLAVTIPEKPERYAATSPSQHLYPLAEKMSQDAKDCLQLVEELALSYESTKYISTEKFPESYDLGNIRTRLKINEKIAAMIKEANIHIHAITSANGIVRFYKVYSEDFEKAAKEGVKVRLIAPITPQNTSLAKEFAEIVEICSLADETPVKYISIDGKQIMFINSIPDDLNATVGEDVGTWTTDPLINEMHEKQFSRIWSLSRPLTKGKSGP